MQKIIRENLLVLVSDLEKFSAAFNPVISRDGHQFLMPRIVINQVGTLIPISEI